MVMPDNPTQTAPIDFGNKADPRSVDMSSDGVRKINRLFDEMLEQRLHLGAQLVVLRKGRVVVDRVAGRARWLGRAPVTPETPFLTFSVSKALTAACVHKLLEEGKLSLDTPIAQYWPEFGCKGKENATVRHALLHQAGIPVRGIFSQVRLWTNWERVARSVANLPAEYPPGTRTAYHLVNFGFILGEIVRRVSGQPIQEYLAQNFLSPLCMNHSWLGLPKEHSREAAGVYSGHLTQIGAAAIFRYPPIRRSILPAATFHSSARNLAVFFQMLANGGIYAGQRYMAEQTITRATGLSYEGYDTVMEREMRWAMGFHLGGHPVSKPKEPSVFGYGSSLRTFGHAGQGSCIAWADPEQQLVVTFTCNRVLSTDDARKRWIRIGDAIWSALP